MRTDYFDDLLPEPVTHVTHRKKDCVTPVQTEKAHKPADSEGVSRTSRMSRTERDNPEHDEAIREHLEERAAIQEYDGELSRPEAEKEARRNLRVFAYRLADNPTAELFFISPGSTMEEARRRLAYQFGAERVIEVREGRPSFPNDR